MFCMSCELLKVLPHWINWIPSITSLAGSGLIAYGAYANLQSVANLPKIPEKLALSSPQVVEGLKKTREKVSEIIECLETIKLNYQKSNQYILAGITILFLGFICDIILKACTS